MNSKNYFDYIEEKLNVLATRVKSRGKLNILDVHLHSENFYRDFFNKLYKWKLENLNNKQQNIESIDLVSNLDKIIIQVSATSTKQKIESALSKEIIKSYSGYRFKFISITEDAIKLKKLTYTNPAGISFLPKEDIYDVGSILRYTNSLNINDKKEIYEFCKKEFAPDIDTLALDSNLSKIVNILSKENLDQEYRDIRLEPFQIERKILYNNLNGSGEIIKKYSIHYNQLEKIYNEFDLSGVNKSNSVFTTIWMEYKKNIDIKKDDELFYLIINNIKEIILKSNNFEKIPSDELDLCILIIVVDAFIRCKIFKNPKEYKYVTTG